MAIQQQKQVVFPRFFLETVEDKAASSREGRKIHVEQESVEIRWAGDKFRVLVAPAHDKCNRDLMTNEWVTYAEKYPEAYDAFKRNVQYHGEGTPIDEAPFLSNAERADMKALNIFTVEALANPTSQAIKALGMGGRALVNKASAWIETTKGNAPILQLAEENTAMKQQIEAMQRQMAELMQQRQSAPVAPQTTAMPQPEADEDDADGSVFSGWTDEALKEFIKKQTGQAPRGVPSHSTLVRMAEEANAKAAA